MLAGLSNAPQYLVNKSEFMENRCILGSDVDSVVLPIDACGGDGALAFARRKKKVIVRMQYCFLLKFFLRSRANRKDLIALPEGKSNRVTLNMAKRSVIQHLSLFTYFSR